MAKIAAYENVIVESFSVTNTSGLHGDIHIRPVKGQKYSPSLHVGCSKKLSKNYPIGTKFKIRAKLTDREDGGEYLYSYPGWKFEVLV